MHSWGGGLGGTRSRIMPHIKTYCDYSYTGHTAGASNGGGSDGGDGGSGSGVGGGGGVVKIHSFLLTSHNMSDAAWGTFMATHSRVRAHTFSKPRTRTAFNI